MTLKRLQSILAAVACVGIASPRPAMAAEPTNAVKDVALRTGGMLVGQVVDQQGTPRVNTPVVVLQGERQVVDTTTDANGVFAAQGLRGGQYQIVTPDGQKLCRFWAPNTAPPSAADAAVVITGNEVFRGQWAAPSGPASYGGRWLDWVRSHPYITAGVVAAAIATPIAIAASDDDSGSNGTGGGPHS
ncbi:MAG: carboxypeptidase-like regulatory domain-containing protein [Pirellulales bacterium]